MNTKISKIIIFIFITSFLITPYITYAAEEEKQPSLADSWIVTPKAGKNSDFEKAFKKHIKFRAKKGDPRVWQTYVPTIGDNLNSYIIRSCCIKWEDIDSYAVWSEKNKIQENWDKNVDKYVATYSHHYNQLDFENSRWPEKDDHFKLFAVTSYKTKVGSGKKIEQSKKKISDYAKKMKWSYSWSWSWGIGGSSNLNLVVPYANYAGITPPKKGFAQVLSDHLGSEAKAQEVLDSWNDNFESTSYSIYQLRDDLSMSDK